MQNARAVLRIIVGHANRDAAAIGAQEMADIARLAATGCVEDRSIKDDAATLGDGKNARRILGQIGIRNGTAGLLQASCLASSKLPGHR